MSGSSERAPDEEENGLKPEPCYDVFVSYSSKDKVWVQGELLPRIEQAGLKAFIDFRDFTRGAPSIRECERGVLMSTKTLLVLTPNYLDSGWTEIENIMVQTLDPANRDLRFIPLLKTECEKPLRLAVFTHIDFTNGADLDLAWRQLLTSLGKPPEQKPPEEPQRGDWFLAHPYPMPPNFTGRVDERKMLTDWLTDAQHPLLALRALGGFGKSALAWHWLMHDVDPKAWPRVVWWSFYEGDSSFDHFLAETLDYLSKGNVKPGSLSGKDTIKAILALLHSTGTLLILDGFERELRAFGGLNAAYQGDDTQSRANDCDCISPLAEDFLRYLAALPDLRSKVLLTTRLRPHVLEAKGGGLLQGCREEELKQMQPADAVDFFLAQGIRGTRAEIEAACAPYGYHPLSLRLLAGWIIADLQQPGDIGAAKRLDVSGDLVARQHHVLEQAYESLMPAPKALLCRIACFRSPVTYDTLKAMAETAGESSTLDASVRDLTARGLLHHDKEEGRFDLHPIVRRYAYDRLAAPGRIVAHTRLRDYFAAVPQPDKVTCLNDLAPVIELYHHTIQAGQIEDAERLLHDRLIPAPLVYQFGAYELCIDMVRLLFPDGEDYTPHLTDEGSQALAMNSLAALYNLSGQPRRAIPLLKRQIAIREKQGLKMNVGIGLGNAANSQIAIGELRAAEVNLRRRIGLCREIEDDLGEAIGHQELGWLLGCRGAYAKSETEIAAAMRMFKKRKNLQGQGINWAYRTLCELLLLRCKPSVAKHQTVIEGARNALKLSEAREHSIGRPNVGLALGGQTYSEFLFFEGTEALHRFKYQDLTFAAQASAVALKSGAAANARYDDGIAVFTLVHEGLMFEASIGGQHISYEPR